MAASTKKSELEVFPTGQKVWRNNIGQYHREDGYAIDYGNGTKTYAFFRNGRLVRIETPNGVRYFNNEGKEIVERSPITEKENGEEKEIDSGGTET